MILNKLERGTVLRLFILILVFSIIVLIGIKTAPWFLEHGNDPEYIRKYLAGFGDAGFLVFIMIQIIQVLIVIIPVDLVNICAGFVYGIPLGFFLSYSGLMLGSVIVFYISRIFGYELVSRLISIKNIEKINGILNSTTGTVSLFLLCCIPLIPKDILMYVAGLTPVKAPRLFLVYGISRIPTTLIWVSVGANAYEKDITGLVISISILVVLLVIVYFIGKNFSKHKTKAQDLKNDI